MANYLRCLKSGLYQLRRSGFYLLHLLLPVLGAGLILGYVPISSARDLIKLSAFFEVLASAFPLIIGILCAILAEQEAKAGHFQRMLTLPGRTGAILSRLTILLGGGLFSTYLATVFFGLGFPLVGGEEPIPASFYVLPPLALWFGNIFNYALHTIVAIRLGRNASIGLGVFGSTVTALMQTGLGAGLWYVLPWGWSIRLSGYALEQVYGLPLRDSGTQFGITTCAVASLVMVGILLLWFKKYGGKRASD